VKKSARLLILSDMHFPFSHQDLVPWLAAIKAYYKPDTVVSVGDETDGAGISFHTHNPDLPGPHDEFERAIAGLKPLYKLFPVMRLCDSNHGSLVWRRAQFAGLPTRVIKSPREILQAPKTWTWHEDLTIALTNGQKVFICHNKSADVLKNSMSMGMNFVQGHFHSSFEIRYWANPNSLNWSMTVGCLVDKKALAFAYGKNIIKKPIVGCGIVLDGLPQLLPMPLDKHGRWTGQIA
jgi:hypothetical protein